MVTLPLGPGGPGGTPTHDPDRPGETPTHGPGGPGGTPTHDPDRPGETPTHGLSGPGETPTHGPDRPGETPTHDPDGPAETPGDLSPDRSGGTHREASSGAGSAADGRRQRELEALAGSVPDPELPVITLAELGVLRRVHERAPHGAVEVELTPTYTGCPAVEAMTTDIEHVLRAHGVPEVAVRVVYAPPWSTDDISDEGRRKLAAHGIAPPRGGRAAAGGGTQGQGPVPLTLAIRCPNCGSTETSLLSRFSSTACKALRRCESCREPFDHFKEV